MNLEFTATEAQKFAEDNRLGEWVELLLTSSRFSPNLDMADQLRQRPTFWRGPIMHPLNELVRVCGPEPQMTFRETVQDWEQNVDRLLALMGKGLELPPLIVKVRHGKHFIADGSHRYEALLRSGRDSYWTIWYSHEECELESLRCLSLPLRS
jgi:hypothetical protein